MGYSIPDYTKRKSIHILCEGAEEFQYIKKLESIGAFHAIYKVTYRDAKGNGNLFALYSDAWSRRSYDIVLIFCDTEKHEKSKEAEVFSNLKKDIDAMFYIFGISKKFIMFANPVTLQVILSHFAPVQLRKPSKKENADIVEKLTGVKNYKARQNDQIKEMMLKINKTNFKRDLKQNLKEISEDEYTCPSTNCMYFFKKLEKADTKWIDDIKRVIEKNES